MSETTTANSLGASLQASTVGPKKNFNVKEAENGFIVGTNNNYQYQEHIAADKEAVIEIIKSFLE